MNSERYSASRLVGQNRFTSKWAKLAKCSQDTALRDIEDLVQKGVLMNVTLHSNPGITLVCFQSPSGI